ncbi:MAG: BMP family protein [Candidatus Thorarchaeota archaeon]
MSSRAGVISSAVIVILVFAAVGGFVFLTNQYVPSHVAVVVIDPGFGDLSMADQAYEGLFEVEVVVSYDFRVVESVSALETLIDELATRGNHDLILVIGTEIGISGALDTVAAAHPNQKFGYIGGYVSQENVASATFAYDEAAFLAGTLAAYLAVGNVNRTGVVGVIGALETDPVIADLIDGFLQGVDYANQTLGNVTLLDVEYVGSYNDTQTAEDLATNMWDPQNGNASVIFAPVRASYMGIRAAMVYANLTWFNGTVNHEPFVIGAEGDQRFLGNPNIEIATGPSWMVTSIVPRSDLSVYRIINATLWGDFTGNLNYGSADGIGNLDNNGIGLADLEEFQQSDNEWVTDRMINMTVDYRLAIINGTITLS